MKRVYLASKMRGLPNHGFDNFDRVKKIMTEWGFDAVSPADIDRKHNPDGKFDESMLPDIIRRDVAALLTCDAICLFGDWTASKGAVAEGYLAEWAALEILILEEEETDEYYSYSLRKVKTSEILFSVTEIKKPRLDN